MDTLLRPLNSTLVPATGTGAFSPGPARRPNGESRWPGDDAHGPQVTAEPPAAGEDEPLWRVTAAG